MANEEDISRKAADALRPGAGSPLSISTDPNRPSPDAVPFRVSRAPNPPPPVEPNAGGPKSRIDHDRENREHLRASLEAAFEQHRAPESNEPRIAVGEAINGAGSASERPSDSASPAPEPAKPMHGMDRRLFSDLAISAAILVGIGVAGLGGIFAGWYHTGAACAVVGFGGALAMRLHLVETTPPPELGTAGWRAFLIISAVITWGFVGWQGWLAFHKPAPVVQGFTQAQLDAAVAKADRGAKSEFVQPSDAITLCSDGPCVPVLLKPGPQYLKGIGLGTGGAVPLVLNGISTVTTERLRVAVDYSEYRSGWMEKTRVSIGELKEPLKGQAEHMQLIYYEKDRPNAGQNKLWWGEPSKNQPVTASMFDGAPLPATLIRGRIAIIGPNGEQHHYFLLVRGADNIGTQVGALAQHDLGNWIEKWESE